ncbi:hypothetical protein Tsubulata_032605 [Turnera subulata]|uniref:Uncharacterized protein n=1 Tax=Turnera subulata TaxID=218843 RepID=A0A9Q0F5C1_9ROSI|nr:hypothetical protein Tsubulata_032605 [Turnera subulata]
MENAGVDPPGTFDWSEDEGLMNPTILRQGRLGSSMYMGTMHTLEAIHNKGKPQNQREYFSVQDMVNMLKRERGEATGHKVKQVQVSNLGTMFKFMEDKGVIKESECKYKGIMQKEYKRNKVKRCWKPANHWVSPTDQVVDDVDLMRRVLDRPVAAVLNIGRASFQKHKIEVILSPLLDSWLLMGISGCLVIDADF